jgi:hypothetical protein
MSDRNDLNRASEHLERAKEHAADAAHHTKEAMEAGAAGTLERTEELAREVGRRAGNAAERAADTARDVGHKAGHVADRVAHAPPDRELERSARTTTEGALDSSGRAIRGAAPTVRSGVEATIGAAGSVFHALERPLGAVIGKIAGKVGGWWNGASAAIASLPEEEQKATELHFESYPARPAGLAYEDALTAYALGYVAAENPDYRERPFEEIETEIQHGFGDRSEEEQRALRDFTRYTYERVMVIRPSQDKPRVEFH